MLILNAILRQIFNLDQTIAALETALLNQQVIQAQKNANAALKQQITITGSADCISMFESVKYIYLIMVS